MLYNIAMLNRLTVKNFAIIEDIDITLESGLTVLTGETGAGKSLIIDTIDLLLGERADKEMIRNGKEKAEIIGYFNVKNPAFPQYYQIWTSIILMEKSPSLEPSHRIKTPSKSMTKP